MQALTAKYNPAKLEEFIGLDLPKRVLGALIADPYQSAWLLLGDPGVGKTTIAFAIANAIGGQIHHVRATECTVEAVNKLAYDCHFTPFLAASKWHIAIIDEADSMSAQAQKAFLSILDATAFPPNTLFLMTANSTSALQDRFLSRTRRIKFNAPSPAEISAFLAEVWAKETEQPKPDFTAIAIAANGNVREALMLLETEMLAPGAFEVAAPVVITAAPVNRETRAHNVTHRTPSSALRDEARRLKGLGNSLKQIACQIGAPQSSVWRWVQ